MVLFIIDNARARACDAREALLFHPLDFLQMAPSKSSLSLRVFASQRTDPHFWSTLPC
jgi:hypothetical protein